MKAATAILALLGVLVTVLAGCGITGGSIPPPPPRAAGVRGEWAWPHGVVAPITVGGVSAPGDEGVLVLSGGKPVAQATVSAEGNFTIGELPAGAYTLHVPAPASAMVADTDVPFAITDGRDVYLAVTLEPLSWSGEVQAIAVEPDIAEIAPGNTANFRAVLTGTNVEHAPVSWLVEGGIGTIDVSGLFSAATPGVGTVAAIIHGLTAKATVTVPGPIAAAEPPSTPGDLGIAGSWR
jgi:hypothetical protein